MDTDIKNNAPDKSWQELVDRAGKSAPPSDFNILEGVLRALADEKRLDAQPISDWVSELTDLIALAWFKPALATLALAALILGWEATTAWADITLNLQLTALNNLF